MSAILSSQDRTRLARLLGMLGSAHDGEVVNAGRLAGRLVCAAGATWVDLLESTLREDRRPESDWRAPWQYDSEPSGRAERAAWQRLVRQCLEHPSRLTEWETNFLRNIRYRRNLTPRQREVLDEIVDKVVTRAGGRS